MVFQTLNFDIGLLEAVFEGGDLLAGGTKQRLRLLTSCAVPLDRLLEIVGVLPGKFEGDIDFVAGFLESGGVFAGELELGLDVTDVLFRHFGELAEMIAFALERVVAAVAKAELELPDEPGEQREVGGEEFLRFARLPRPGFGAGGEERHFSGEGIGREWWGGGRGWRRKMPRAPGYS